MSNTNTPLNPFEKGNQYYKLATHTGRPKRYATPDDLWEAATGYFTWCTTTPVIIYRPGRGKLVPVLKNREMSLKDLYKWLGICNLYYYKKLPDFTRKVHRIHNAIDHYNFIHAAAGLIKGRSVGHALRNERFCLPSINDPDTCVTPPAPSENVGVRPPATSIKNTIPSLLKKTRIDTKKVRFSKRNLYITSPSSFERAGERSHTIPIKKVLIDMRKVRFPT